MFELPLDMQGYRLIESHGPEGMSSTVCVCVCVCVCVGGVI